MPGEPDERLLPALEVAEHRVAEERLDVAAVARPSGRRAHERIQSHGAFWSDLWIGQVHEAIGLRHGQRAQQDLKREREDGDVDADAERERERSDDGERLLPAQRSQRQPEIGERVLDRGDREPCAHAVLRLLDAAELDFATQASGGQLTIKAPNLKGRAPGAEASVVERVRHVLDSEIAPMLAAHGGKVALEQVDAGGVVVLRFGGGCHGCGMVDVTLKQGIENMLRHYVPEVVSVEQIV